MLKQIEQEDTTKDTSKEAFFKDYFAKDRKKANEILSKLCQEKIEIEKILTPEEILEKVYKDNQYYILGKNKKGKEIIVVLNINEVMDDEKEAE